MNQKTRKQSILIKILIPASVLILVICMMLGLLAYSRIKSGMTAMGVEEAEMAAKVAAEIMINIASDSKSIMDSSQKTVKNISEAELNITDVSATMQEMSAGMEETSASIGQINKFCRFCI